MKRRKRKKQVYGDYYEKLMEPTYIKHYQEYLKRIKTLRKKVISLGDVPKKETQLIKTLDYFVELINLATNFVDKGMLKWWPIEKKEELREFEEIVYTLTCRDCESILVQNKTPIGNTVTYDTLYIGVMHEIEDSNPYVKTKSINGKLYQIDVDFASISDWINWEVTAVNGLKVKLKQRDLAQLDEKLKGKLLNAIETVLK